MTNNPPRNLRYGEADAEKYSKLTQDSLSPFHGVTFKDGHRLVVLEYSEWKRRILRLQGESK